MSEIFDNLNEIASQKLEFILFRKSGAIISTINFKRDKSRDIFSLFPKSEIDFLRFNLNSPQIPKFILLKSNFGAMLVFVGIYPQTDTFLAIHIKINEKELIYCIKNKLINGVLLSPSFEQADFYKRERKLSLELTSIIKLLNSAFPQNTDYTQSIESMEKAAGFTSSLAKSSFALFGCNATVLIDSNIDVFIDTLNISSRRIHFCIIYLAFCAYNYAKDKRLCFNIQSREGFMLLESFFELKEDFKIEEEYSLENISYTSGTFNGSFYLKMSPHYLVEDAFIKVPEKEFKYTWEAE